MQETVAEADGGSKEVRAAGQNTVASDGRRLDPGGLNRRRNSRVRSESLPARPEHRLR